MHEPKSADYFLDITSEVCPLTFVRTKLLVERMAAGEVLQVRLNAGEPLENVPRSLAELGHAILSLELENRENPAGPYLLRVRKS
ncbi:MAG TPA: sulfurtransferase TusA family protein [Azospirillum sp.]|nr:sulfurtransferase TusA family protein [Azospirillum sp.]